jgi:hypothetical protein
MHVRFLQPYLTYRPGDEATVTTDLALELVEKAIAEPAGKSMSRPPADKSMIGRRIENK